MTELPLHIRYVGVPPVKCQGIKTKLVPFILRSLSWQDSDGGRWIEPFLGSGVVALNLAPKRAMLADTNVHIIRLYRGIQTGEISASAVRDFLVSEGKKLEKGGADYYYEVRDRFNANGSPLDFLFLNRSCFNGVMRFNRKGAFNVPFGHKPLRFSKAYVTKISNQVNWVARQMRDKDWQIRVADWREVFAEVNPSDFVYLDPPYIGRHTDYYNSWDDQEAAAMASAAGQLPCGYALSMWLENRHRRNSHLDDHWSGLELRKCQHFYHVGSTEDLRNEMQEALVIKPGFASPEDTAPREEALRPSQLALAV